MADPSVLGLLGSNDLAQFTNSVEQSDPYGLAGRSLGAAQFDTSTWSPATSGITAFSKAFLSGLLGNYARQNAADQTNAVIGVLPQLRSDPMSVSVPEGVNADAFATFKGNAILKNYAAQEYRNQTLADLMQKVGIARLTEKEEVIGRNEGYNALPDQGSQNPDSPAYKIGQDKIAVERQLANDFINRASDFKNKEQGVKALVEAYKDPAGTSDYELIRRAAQAVEPGLAVRADDIASIQGAASILGMSTEMVSAAISGQTKLTDDVRAGILRIGKRSLNASLDNYNTIRENFLQRARAAKLNESSIVPFGAGKSFEELYPNLDISLGTTPSAAPVMENTIVAPDGNTYVFTD